VHPDAITFLGLLVVAVACTFIAQGQFALGGIILLAGLPLDAVDGAVARAMQRQGRFGAVLDSTLDRYADGFIFIALGYYFAQQDRFEWLLIALLAGVGTQAVSYVRARADGVNLNVTIGLFTRMERVAVILVMLLVPSLLEIGVLILAIGTNFTALQRLFFVYKMLDEQGE
jgi:phosphatidylglycerophosphate synthase